DKDTPGRGWLGCLVSYRFQAARAPRAPAPLFRAACPVASAHPLGTLPLRTDVPTDDPAPSTRTAAMADAAHRSQAMPVMHRSAVRAAPSITRAGVPAHVASRRKVPN